MWLDNDGSEELAEVLQAHPMLSWIQLPWAGVDAFATTIAQYSRPGRVFTCAKGAYAQPVAEHALAMILALMRSLPQRARLTSWEEDVRGVSLHRRRVTILGAGGIARELIRLLAPFGCDITVVRRVSAPVPGATRTVTAQNLDEVLPTTDVLVIAAALTSQTRSIIGDQQISLIPQGAFLVNIARGPLVDSDALLVALLSAHLGGAALDVTDPEPLPVGHPLWLAPNILITPHQADTPEMTRPLLAERISVNVRAFMNDDDMVGVVDPLLEY
jgi:phosphoglycerate dehydrogenase-like enzyme